jgi:Ca-activated chloride channel family protein
MLALPLLPVVYVWLLRRRTQAALRFSHLGTVRAAMAGRSWRRHVPPALLWLACAALLLAAARPGGQGAAALGPHHRGAGHRHFTKHARQ